MRQPTRRLAPCLAALLTLALAGCDDDPDVTSTGDPPPPDAERVDAEFDGSTVEEPPTWHAHIRPLVEVHCAGCHEPDAVSGYDLGDTTWQGDAPPWWAGAMVATVLEGSMPPVLPDTACRPVEGRVRLSEEEVALFAAWRAGGYLEGNPGDFVPPAPLPTAQPGPATMTLDAGAAYIPAFVGGSDRRCLPLELTVEDAVWLSGFAVRPGDRRMVRRAELYAVDPLFADAVSALDEQAPGVGYPCHGGPGVDGYRPLGIWLPDEPPFILPFDHGFEVGAGSRLVLEVHYSARAIGDEVPAERTGVDVWQLDEAPGNRVEAVELIHGNLQVPAERRLTQGRDFTMGVEGTLIGAWSRMGARGVSMEMVSLGADEPDGQGGPDEACVLDVPAFDPDWVGAWRFPPPQWLAVSPGDVVELRCTHDNRDNPLTLPWGRGSSGARCDGALLLARPVEAIGGLPQCGLFDPCVAGCPEGEGGGPDAGCFARCHAVGERVCTPCLLRATGICGRGACEAELDRLGACSADCSADLGCIIERCLAPFGALAACIEAPIARGECAAPYETCGVQFVP